MPFWRSKRCNDWSSQHNTNQHHSVSTAAMPSGKIHQTSLYVFAAVPIIISFVAMIVISVQEGAHDGQELLPFVVPEYDCTNQSVIYNTTMYALDGAIRASRNRLYVTLAVIFLYSGSILVLMVNHESVVRDYAAGTELSARVQTVDTTIVRDNFAVDSDDDGSLPDFGI